MVCSDPPLSHAAAYDDLQTAIDMTACRGLDSLAACGSPACQLIRAASSWIDANASVRRDQAGRKGWPIMKLARDCAGLDCPRSIWHMHD